MKDEPLILGLESSCDDTSAAVIRGSRLLSNLISSQKVHAQYGGVVPELASRAHMCNVVPVVAEAIREAQVEVQDLDAIAFTRGPGLLGSLLVGVSFAKGLALANSIDLVEVNHLQGHVLAPFLQMKCCEPIPSFPYLSLLVSGGHTQIIRVKDPMRMEVLGNTIDDAAGEAFDKCAKAIGLPYPGGPHVDRLAQEGDPQSFKLARPMPHGMDFSFSGLKTSFLYLVRDELAKDPHFIESRKADLCASLQHTIITILLAKLRKAIKESGIRCVAVGGGVAANSGLRNAMQQMADQERVDLFLPERRFTTDNAAMIAIAGLFRYRAGIRTSQDIGALARWSVAQ